MSYDPTNWQDAITPVDASNLNKLEQAVGDNADSIDAINNIETQSISQPESIEGLTISNWQNVTISKKAGFVTLTFNFNGMFTVSGSWIILFQLPSGWRPTVGFYHDFQEQSGNSMIILQVATNGNVYMQSSAVMTASNWIRQCITFPAA